jgi:hypothetical protein
MARDKNFIASRRTNLAACIAATLAFAATATVSYATTVTSCLDDGSPGTLRYAVLTADEGGLVDAQGLACTITLQGTSINVDQNSLTIQGPASSTLTIDAAGTSRVFFHGTAAGTLVLNNLTVMNGLATGDRSFGGCVYSLGPIGTTNLVVTGCHARGTTAAGGGGIAAFSTLSMSGGSVDGNLAESTQGANGVATVGGGGILADGKVVLRGSSISGNHAHANGGFAYGGGLYLIAGLDAQNSTIDGNLADVETFDAQQSFSIGGGLTTSRTGNNSISFKMTNSTVSRNHADGSGGLLVSGIDTDVASVINSTISGNVANIEFGGAAFGQILAMYDTTVAFNTAGSYGGGGLVADGDKLILQGTIIADNSPTGSMFAADLDGTAVISGEDNLVKIVGSSMTLPNGTIRLDPQLGVLRNNGGPTQTHALMPGSPAIDAGNNSAKAAYDQRSIGFPRTVGARQDIGAYEYNPDDIFANGFN